MLTGVAFAPDGRTQPTISDDQTLRFFRKLLPGWQYVPRVLVTDKLASYPAARRRVLPSVEHRR